MAVVALPQRSEPIALPDALSGPRYWLRGYRTMLAWDLRNLRLVLPVMTSVQILAGAGFVLGIAIFFHHIPETAALFVVTGVPVINLITIGLIFEPQLVADQRLQQTYDFLRSLPAPRSMMLAAWYTATLAPAIPAMAFALWVGVLRYHIHLSITPALVPAVLAVSLTGTLMGYALAHAVSQAMTTRMISQALVFVMFGFSPVMFPARQLPGWLLRANEWLPFGSMAKVMRAALAPDLVSGVGRAYLVVAAWAVLSSIVAAWAVGRRK